MFIITWEVLYTSITLSPFILLGASVVVLSVSETFKLISGD